MSAKGQGRLFKGNVWGIKFPALQVDSVTKAFINVASFMTFSFQQFMVDISACSLTEDVSAQLGVPVSLHPLGNWR